nr:hypothetical protein [Tanacetum cinerariifolium]
MESYMWFYIFGVQTLDPALKEAHIHFARTNRGFGGEAARLLAERQGF